MYNRILLFFLLSLCCNFLLAADDKKEDNLAACGIDIDVISVKGQSGQMLHYLFFMNVGEASLDDIEVTMWNPDGYSSEELGIKKERYITQDLGQEQNFSLGQIHSNGGTTFWTPFQIPAGKELNLNFSISANDLSFAHQIVFSEIDGKIFTAKQLHGSD